MTDAELRAIVRDAVARHLGRAEIRTPAAPAGPAASAHHPRPAAPWQHHASHHLYVSLVNTDEACVIEPSVACDHCGYCKSHGH
jgi:hypothetical protein